MQKQKPDKKDQIHEAIKGLLKNLSEGDSSFIAQSDEETKEQDLPKELLKLEGLDDEIEQLLSMLQTRETDLSKLQSMLILLINKYISSKKTKNSKTSQKEIKKMVEKEVAKASTMIIEQYTNFLKERNYEVGKEKDPYLLSNSFAKAQLKRLVKSFAVYEIYKVMTPRRIAGETKLDNFVNNVMSRHDVKYATRFAGGRQADIAGYAPKVKNTLRQQNVRNKQLLGR
jgi:Family of unknown function (DUF5394)